MKKYLLPLLMLVLAVEALNPLHASSQDESKVTDKKTIVLKNQMLIAVAKPQVQIVPGESQEQKEVKAKALADSRVVIPRERVEAPAPAAEYNLDELRSLYRSAASKFGIDWKLIEAVHQVETGKSAQCKKNPSGATGPMQFIPSTFRHYANEGSDICSLNDSVYAAANLLASSGADTGDIDSALFNYNHSTSYVNLVKSIMNSI
ncbi:MAG: lytic transglycosylase domain-containing protein [Dehalococcoidales bacterium]|nr:lytic transglycosylase domain-containing protein [Dehalococcoidales bacterium]